MSGRTQDYRRLEAAHEVASRARSIVLKEALAERNRAAVDLTARLCFPEQQRFIKSPARRKAVFCPRRSGKSMAIGIGLLLEPALSFPGRKWLYLGLSKEAAENTIYKDILCPTLDSLKIRTSYNRTLKVLRLPNGSEIKISGYDSSPDEMTKVLGGKYHTAVLDEAQAATQDMRLIVEGRLAPAVADYVQHGGGQIVLGGTPGLLMGEHYWFGVTRRDAPRIAGWEVHEWNVTDNPYMADAFGLVCKDLLASQGPTYQDDPIFRREWLGEWVLDEGSKVYKYDARRNILLDDKLARELLAGPRSIGGAKWQYLVGVDLGWEDATAVVVIAYSKTDPCCYVVRSEKHKHTVLSTVGAILTELNARYRPAAMVLDTAGIGKQLAESLRADYRIPVVAAVKPEKQNTIGRMNSDLMGGLIKVIPETNRDLVREWSELVTDRKAWAERKEWKEADKFANHLADAALYAWRESQHRSARPAEQGTPKDLGDMLLARRKKIAAELGVGRAAAYERRGDDAEDVRGTVLRFRGGAA